jgi:hypothetical protein
MLAPDDGAPTRGRPWLRQRSSPVWPAAAAGSWAPASKRGGGSQSRDGGRIELPGHWTNARLAAGERHKKGWAEILATVANRGCGTVTPSPPPRWCREAALPSSRAQRIPLPPSHLLSCSCASMAGEFVASMPPLLLLPPTRFGAGRGGMVKNNA